MGIRAVSGLSDAFFFARGDQPALAGLPDELSRILSSSFEVTAD